jgi:hypothetical protein
LGKKKSHQQYRNKLAATNKDKTNIFPTYFKIAQNKSSENDRKK